MCIRDSFCRGKKKIEFNDILRLTNLSENYDVSELVDNCLIKNKKKTLNILNENIPSTDDNILILKTFLYKLKRLRKLRLNFDEEKDIDVKQIEDVFFMRKRWEKIVWTSRPNLLYVQGKHNHNQ